MSETVVETTVEKQLPEVQDPHGLLAAYEKAKADLVALREQNKSLSERLEARNAEDAESPYRAKALAAETRLALQSLGIKDVDRIFPYVGTEGLDFDEEDKVTGLTERLATLKKDLPEIFDPKVRAGGKADIFANDNVEVKENPLKAAVHKALS